MATYMKFELNDGTVVYIEAFEPTKNASGLLPATRGENAAEQPAQSLEKAFEGVGKMAAAMMENVRAGFASGPEDISISFGLKAATEIGNLVVSRGGVDNNYGITVRWRNEKKAEKDAEKEGEKETKDTKETKEAE
jgi:hypothetical protein